MSKMTSVRLNDGLAIKLDALAALLDRPRAWVIEQAIARYVEEETPEVTAIAEALAEYESGNAHFSSHEDVMRRMDEKLRAAIPDATPVA
jgi:predicted transcriptional regulator